jgi:hypothetical protein
MTKPARNPPKGEDIEDIIFFILGLQENGTSITKPFPYQK